MKALATISRAPVTPTPIEPDFALADMAVFTVIPVNFHGIVALGGMVAVYATDLIDREGILEGAYYVRESQRPAACMAWEQWLQREVEERYRRVGPRSPLQIRREVVQAIRWPSADDWSLRLASGYVDGPYHDWAFGCDLIGKVVGIYHPCAVSA